MKKTGIAILMSALLTAAPACFCQNISDEAQIMFEEAIGMRKKGDNTKAVELFERALRADRGILAYDDEGLVESLRAKTEKSLQKNPDDVKLLETMGFIYAVCYSDNETAIKYYKQVAEKVNNPVVREKTNTLILRLQAASQASNSYSQEVTASLRDERLKAWSEMEESDRAAREQAEREEYSNKLESAYQDKEELTNRVPQLEDELKEMEEAYDKANRLWFATNDELYERRRRRLKNSLVEKRAEVEKAQKDLAKAERMAELLESQGEPYADEGTDASAGTDASSNDESYESDDSLESGEALYSNDETKETDSSENYDESENTSQDSDAADDSEHSEESAADSLSDLIDSL